jgi:DNA gyrase subunit A
MEFVKAPDFPTGGIIYGLTGVREGFRTGRGRCVVRAKTEIETDDKGREAIIVHRNSISDQQSGFDYQNCRIGQ